MRNAALIKGSEPEGRPGLDSKPTYPFTAVVGQDKAKKALVLNAIDPTIGGVLVSGPKGSGKSLLVRSFSDVLPDVMHVEDCPFRCSPDDPTNMCPGCLARFEAGEELPVTWSRMRVVLIPLSVTDDMLVGSIDLDRVVDEGVRSLRPGLLAEANQNILYIDEVNLLPDHITDNILDAAASGWNHVEREGFSVQHPSRFTLVGTMNPEEGDLRPQILDRFGVYAETANIEDPELRALVIERNEEFFSDPSDFTAEHSGELEELRSRIREARRRLPGIEAPPEICSIVAETCTRLRVDGFRPDIVSVKTARALAAFNGRDAISPEDVNFSVELALGHRTRRSGLAPPPSKAEIRKVLGRARSALKFKLKFPMPAVRGFFEIPGEVFDKLLAKARMGLLLTLLSLGILVASTAYLLEIVRGMVYPSPPTPPIVALEIAAGVLISLILSGITWSRRRHEESIGLIDLSNISIEASGRLPPPQRAKATGGGTVQARVSYGKGVVETPDYGLKILEPMKIAPKGPDRLRLRRLGRPVRGSGYARGRRTKVISSSSRGRYAWYQIPKGGRGDVALVPTLRAAALHQRERGREDGRILITPDDIRVKVREYRAPFSIVLLVDMSLSMVGSVDNIIQTVYSLHRDVYRQRDRVGLIVFKGSKAFTIQHPTRNLKAVVEKLRGVGASDFTPMAAGLFEAYKALKQEKLRNKDAIPHLLVISDGIANVPLDVPLSPLTRRRYSSEAQADAFDVARLIAKAGYRVYVINTSHSEKEARDIPVMVEGRRLRFTPTQFLMEISRLTKGDYVGHLRQEEAGLP
jgi:Mg-chelatase subunit ChlI/Mg-chelatase subunit ChlD